MEILYATINAVFASVVSNFKSRGLHVTHSGLFSKLDSVTLLTLLYLKQFDRVPMFVSRLGHRHLSRFLSRYRRRCWLLATGQADPTQLNSSKPVIIRHFSTHLAFLNMRRLASSRMLRTIYSYLQRPSLWRCDTVL